MSKQNLPSAEHELMNKNNSRRLIDLRKKNNLTTEEIEELTRLENWQQTRSKFLSDSADSNFVKLKKGLKVFLFDLQNFREFEKIGKLKFDELLKEIEDLKKLGKTNEQLVSEGLIDKISLDLVTQYQKFKEQISKFKETESDERNLKALMSKIIELSPLFKIKLKSDSLTKEIDAAFKTGNMNKFHELMKEQRLFNSQNQDNLIKLSYGLRSISNLLKNLDLNEKEINEIQEIIKNSFANESSRNNGAQIDDDKKFKFNFSLKDPDKKRLKTTLVFVNNIEESIKSGNLTIDELRENLAKLKSNYDKVKFVINDHSKILGENPDLSNSSTKVPYLDYYLAQKALFARSIEICNMAIICSEKGIDFAASKEAYYSALENGKAGDRFKYIESQTPLSDCEAFKEANLVFRLKFVLDHKGSNQYDYHNIKDIVEIAEDLIDSKSEVDLAFTNKIFNILREIQQVVLESSIQIDENLDKRLFNAFSEILPKINPDILKKNFFGLDKKIKDMEKDIKSLQDKINDKQQPGRELLQNRQNRLKRSLAIMVGFQGKKLIDMMEDRQKSNNKNNNQPGPNPKPENVSKAKAGDQQEKS